MEGLGHAEHEWNVGQLVGYDHPFLHVTESTVVYTWIALAVIAILIIAARIAFTTRFGRYIVGTIINYFIDLIENALPSFSFQHCAFVTTLFVYITVCNLVALIPWVEEPTKDLNTTLALGIIAFVYRQIIEIHMHGILAYIKGYLKPFFIMAPVNVIGRLATIVSISFRLFGNIFGGSIITTLYFHAIERSLITVLVCPPISMIVTLFFIVFEGFLQSFVFTMLTLTYLSMTIQGEGGH